MRLKIGEKMELKNCPLVSVVMPIYNHEDFVAQALNSILHQTYPNIEVILIDDGSKDASCARVEEVISNWNETKHVERNIVFIKQSNQGAHNAINRGLALSKGEWLTILNSDDYYHLQRIEKLFKIASESKAEIAFTYVAGVDAKSEFLTSNHDWMKWYEGMKYYLFLISNPTVGFTLLQGNIAVSSGNLFFKNELFQRVGVFKDLKIVHDLDFILRALILTEPLMIREELYYYRVHGKNTFLESQNLLDVELQEIYKTYLVNVTARPPENLMAPCYWYWPLEFGKVRVQLKMDAALDAFIMHPAKQVTIKQQNKEPQAVAYKKNGPHITLISHELSLSGAPKLVADLALSLKAKGYVPNVISIFEGPMRAELEKNGIPVFSAAKKGSKSRERLSLDMLKAIFYLCYAFCFKTKKTVIANSIVSWPMVLLLAMLRPWRRPIWYIHESYTPLVAIRGSLARYLAPLFNWVCSKNPPRLWFGSQGTQEAWSHSGLPKGDVVYWSGISIKPVPELKQKRLTRLLVVGTASARKGTHHLVEAFIDCIKKGKIAEDVVLTIVGFPAVVSQDFLNLGDTILKVVHGYQDRIKMIGSVEPDILEAYYEQTDLFIQPSILECLPLSLLTAMSYGLPIITTNVDGCVEAIQDRESGYVCLPYNVESLADAIVEALDHPAESISMGKKAREVFCNKFCLEVTEQVIFNHLRS